jgi:hypothetical protein
VHTGPYSLIKTIGPAHLSFADRGLTFATNSERGLCIRFATPVRGLDPLGLVRHPAVTVTVADCDGLATHDAQALSVGVLSIGVLGQAWRCRDGRSQGTRGQ